MIDGTQVDSDYGSFDGTVIATLYGITLVVKLSGEDGNMFGSNDGCVLFIAVGVVDNLEPCADGGWFEAEVLRTLDGVLVDVKLGITD